MSTKATATKSKSKPQSESTPSVPVSVPVVETAPVDTTVKAPRKSSKKVASEPVSSVVVTPPPQVLESSSSSDVNVVVSEAPNDAYSQLSSLYAELFSELSLVASTVSSLKAKLKQAEKAQGKLNKDALKHSRRKASRSGTGVARAPSGFRKPAKISNELATFLNKPFGSEMARTEVTKEINAYIRANNLQDAKNGRVIIPDRKLTDLLKVDGTKELTYFNLQKFMKIHFEKMKKPVVASTTE